MNDRFCDRQDLQNACVNIKIPKPLLRCFGALYDFNYLSYDVTARELLNVDGDDDARDNEDDDATLGDNDKDENEYGEGDDDEKHEDADNDEELLGENTDNYDNTEDENSNDDFQTEELNKKRKEIGYKKLSLSKCRKVQSIFQIMYFVFHQGTKRTPMHMMIGESAHDYGGKLLLNSLSKRGLAISYTECRRFHFDMASFTSLSHETKVSLPCHFDPAEFTCGATGNWDHEGSTSIHDAVTVLY